MKRLVLTILFFVAIASVTPKRSNAQCAMCKQTAENSADSEAKGLNIGILYLLIVPYALVGGIGYWWYAQKKKEKTS